jgi:hypothetical protein
MIFPEIDGFAAESITTAAPAVDPGAAGQLDFQVARAAANGARDSAMAVTAFGRDLTDTAAGTDGGMSWLIGLQGLGTESMWGGFYGTPPKHGCKTKGGKRST